MSNQFLFAVQMTLQWAAIALNQQGLLEVRLW